MKEFIVLIFCVFIVTNDISCRFVNKNEDGNEIEANMTVRENKKNKPGSGNLIQVIENYEKSKVNAFKEDENAFSKVSSDRKLQNFKIFGALTIQTRYHDNVVF